MARPISRAAQRALEIPEDYAPYATKAPTDLQRRLGDWIMEKTGVTFVTKKEEAAYREGVRLAVALRMKFQASPENQDAIAERAENKTAEDLEAAKTMPAPGKKSSSRRTPPRDPEAAPAKATKATARKTAPAKAAKTAPAKVAVVEPETDDDTEAVTEPVKATGRRPARRPARNASADAEVPF
jgi:hypothetical protein